MACAAYGNGWEAKNEAELCVKINRKLKEIIINIAQTMMRGVRTKLRKKTENGPFMRLCGKCC
jgi:hypothetical protein